MSHSLEPIAIVGVGCLFPGADNPERFWRNLLARQCEIRPVPETRWDIAAYYDSEHRDPERSHSHIGAFVDAFEKDAVKFRIPPISMPSIDRAQFMCLEVTHQALASAGYLEKGFPKARTGAIVGNSMGGELARLYCARANWPTFEHALRESPHFAGLGQGAQDAFRRDVERIFKSSLPPFTEDSCAGTLASILAGRLCNRFDIRGAAFTIDGACASSLTAVELAVMSLRTHRHDLVLAGATDTSVDPTEYVLFSNLQALSDTGCWPFDQRADGFVMGEGAAMLALKRWSDARRDGDPVLALIRAVGSSSDGAVSGITAPDPDGQVAAMNRAYEGLDFGPDAIGLIEAHGTGTPLGDRTELTSVARVFGPHVPSRSIPIGSVKSNIGHLKTAAGMAGLIKVIQALRHGVRPPTIGCDRPRDDVDWSRLPVRLCTDADPWPGDGRPRRAAVNSFGFGGLNSHAVIEEAPRSGVAVSVPAGCGDHEAAADWPATLVIFRAPDPAALRAQVSGARDALRRGAVDLSALAARAPSPGPAAIASLAIVAEDAETLDAHLGRALDVLASGERDELILAQGIYYAARPLGSGEKIAFLYPGQGAQYLGMAADLAARVPAARARIAQIAERAHEWTGVDIKEALTAFPQDLDAAERARLEAHLVRTDVNHPALLGLGAAIGDVLASAGVRPDMVCGHSVGEIAALHAGGVYDLESAVAVLSARGQRIYEECYRRGTMASARAPAGAVAAVLADVDGYVQIANKNCPAQTVISGEIEAVELAVARLEAADIPCACLNVSSGFHTSLMASLVQSFRWFLDKFPVRPPRVPVQSNTRGGPYPTDGDFEATVRDTLAAHLTRPVEFIRNVESMYADGARLFVEIGPGSTLCSFVDSILAERPHWAVATHIRRRPGALQLLHALAYCAARGVAVELGPPRRGRSQTSAAPTAAPWTAELPDADPTVVAEWLATRGDFLADMARLDFEHFARGRGQIEPNPSPKILPAPELDPALVTIVIDRVAEMTGYPTEVIGLDMDIEAELGLDSIKRVEIVAALERQLGVQLPPDESRRRHRLSTLRALVQAFAALASDLKDSAAIDAVEDDAARRTDAVRWFCRPAECALPTAPDGPALPGADVALLGGADGVTTLVARALEGIGASVEIIGPSDPVDRLSPYCDAVIDLSSFGEDAIPDAEWAQRVDRRARRLHSIATQVLDGLHHHRIDLIRWMVVTSTGGRHGDGPTPRGAALAGVSQGLARVLAVEHAGALCARFVDFAPDSTVATVARAVIDELTHPGDEPEVGYRDGRRLAMRWAPDPEAPPRAELGDAPVVLAIGGARGATAAIARALPVSGRGTMLVVGKSPLDAAATPGIDFETARAFALTARDADGSDGPEASPAALDRAAWHRVWAGERAQTLAELRATGWHVEYRAIDLTAPEAPLALADLLRGFPRIDAVLHGAGALVERSFVDFSADDFVDAFRTKTVGTAALLAALDRVDIGTFVHLSSVVGRWGSAGLAPYAVGHAVASLLVSARRGRAAGRWVNLHYGPWLHVGMTRVGETIDRLGGAGATFVTEAIGARLGTATLDGDAPLEAAIRGPEPHGTWTPTTPIAAAPRPPAAPLLDTVAISDDGRPGRAHGMRALDRERDRFIAEHLIAEEALLPGMVGLEMLAQTGAALVSAEAALVAIEDAQFLRPVRFPKPEPRTVHTAVWPVDDTPGTFEAQLRSRFTPPDGGPTQSRVHIRCRLVFGQRPPFPPPSLVVPRIGIGRLWVDAEPFFRVELKKDRLGAFRNVHGFVSMTPDGVVAEGAPLAIRGVGEPRLTGNPIRLDAMAFNQDFWSAMHTRNWWHFLAAMARLEFFGPPDPDDDEARTFSTRILGHDDHSYTCEVEAFDSQGRIRERMRGLVKHAADPGDAVKATAPIWQDLRRPPMVRRLADALGIEGPMALAQISPAVLGDGADVDARARRCVAESVRDQLGGDVGPIITDFAPGLAVAAGASRSVRVGVSAQEIAVEVHGDALAFATEVAVERVRTAAPERGEVSRVLAGALLHAAKVAAGRAVGVDAPLTAWTLDEVTAGDRDVTFRLRGPHGDARAVAYQHDHYAVALGIAGP